MVGEKRTKKPLLNGKRCVLIAIALYFVFAIVGQQSKLNALGNEIEQTSRMIEEKNKEVEQLGDKEKLYSQNDEIERIARDKLGFVRSDETVFVDVTGK